MAKVMQINSLTGLRGVLALWVVWYHMTIGLLFSHFPAGERFGHAVSYILLSGFMAVDVFFLLSGFIMCYVYEHDLKQARGVGRALHFYALRLARLYPVHLTVMLIYLALKLDGVVFLVEECGNPLAALVPCEHFGVRGFIEQLLLVSSWGWNPQTIWNDPAWSINSEWFMYLLFPLLIPFISQVKSAKRSIILGLLSLALMILALWQGDRLYAHFAEDEHGLVRVTGCFLCGCFMYQFYRSDVYQHLPWPQIGVGCLAAVLFLCTTSYLFLTVPLFAALLLSLAQPEVVQGGVNYLSRALATRGMVWLGKISYSLYMIHLLVIEVMGLVMQHRGTPPAQMSTLEALGAMSFLTMLSIIAATILFYAIEEPARRRLHRMIDRTFSYD